MSAPSGLIQKLWNYCNILRDDGLSYGDYVEQLTFLLFLKIADEQSRPPFNNPSPMVAEVERRLSVVKELESVVTANLQRSVPFAAINPAENIHRSVGMNPPFFIHP